MPPPVATRVTDSRIKVLAAGEDLLLDAGAEHILFVPDLIPDVSGELGRKHGLGSGRVGGETGDVGVLSSVLSNLDSRVGISLKEDKKACMLT